MDSVNLKFCRFLQKIKLIVLLLIVSFISIQLQAQISRGGVPASFRLDQLDENDNEYSPKVTFSLKNIERIEKQCTAYEFGTILPFNQSLGDPHFGRQIVDYNGNTVWKATISSENALALGLYFSDFYLPKGAELYIYTPDKKQIIGSFTEINNSETGLFATELILGDKLVIEYNEPASVAGLGRFTIDEVLHAYRGVSILKNTNDFGGSGSCEVNVNCSEGTGYGNQKNSVVRLLIKEGTSTYWCTGSLINNVNNDRKPYILTADHCAADASTTNLNQWIFYFNYQSETCNNPATEPVAKTMTGCTKIAASSNSGTMGSDFYMVLLNENIPADYNAYFMGWDRRGDGSTNGVTIHHPEGDIKKISTYTTALTTATYSFSGAATNGSWEVFWSATANGHGVTEGGSSGAPIYSQEGFLIGTLTGGWALCSNLTGEDYFGKFDFHWDKNGSTPATQLKPWLDPDNTGTFFLQGFSVEDTIPPTFTVPDPVAINCDDDQNNLALTGDVIDEWDNNSVGQATYIDVTDNTNPCAIIITRTWRLVDNYGNKVEQEQTITVADYTPPTFTQPVDITIDMTDDPNNLTLTGDVSDEADNCDPSTLNATYSDLRDDTDFYEILITRTWTLSDNCGNTTTHDQIVRLANSFFDIFPNPSNGQITLKFDQTTYGKTYTIRIVNILGQSILLDKFIVDNQLDFNLQYLQKGVYFIEITAVNQQQTEKFIIQ